MAKKTRRRASRGKSAPTKLSVEDIERKARQDLAGGRHREAIEGFKQLLKLQPLPAFRYALADAYAGRARDLAAKDMLKEALAIWENRAALGEGIAFDPDQAALLLRMGRVESVLALLAQGVDIPRTEHERLRSLLAAAHLAGEKAIVERLPADDPVVLHAEPARAALAAYCEGETAALQEALAAIPFRSPYRDWVQILKALQRLPDKPGEAADLLARVGDGSAFCQLRRAAQLALLPEESFVEALRGAGTGSVRFACVLRGWPQARIALWEELNRLGATPRPETLLRLMYRHRDALGPDWTRRRGLRLLIEGFPAASRKRLKAAGAAPLNNEESLLLAAWSAEQREDLWEGQEHWKSYTRHLIREGSAGGQAGERSLRIALTLRRCDHVGDVLSRATPSADSDDLDRLIAGQVEDSLTWDPDHRDTYLRLIGYYRQGKRLKDVRRLLKQAKKRWPKDMRVLETELDVALQTGAFKKAAGLAREMLALDSINSGVRDRLVEAHLAHARKQVVKGRLDLARKELAQAEEWARSTHARDQLDLTSGLIAVIDDADRGSTVLHDLLVRLGGGVAGHLTLALAGEALHLSVQQLFKRIGVEMPAVQGRDDLLATLARLRHHLDGGGRLTREVGSSLSGRLAKAPWSDLSKSETEAACDTLRRCELHETRLRAARTALRRWHGAPVFELHAFEAKYPGHHRACSVKDVDRLEGALDRARKEGDTRIAMRIDEVLAGLGPLRFGHMPFAPPAPAGPVSVAPEAKAVGMLIEKLGLEKAMSALELPSEMKRELKRLAREQGEEAVAEMLVTFFEMAAAIAEGEGWPPFSAAPPDGKPPKPKRERPKPGFPRDRGQDDDPFDQLDLF